MGPLSELERGDERVQASLGLADEHVVGVAEFVRTRAGGRTTDHGADPAPVGARDHGVHRVAVDEHARHQHRVRPAQVLLLKRRDVQIEDAQIPAPRKERCQRRESEWWMGSAFSDDANGVLETPVRLWREGLHQKDVHAREDAHSQVMESSRRRPGVATLAPTRRGKAPASGRRAAQGRNPATRRCAPVT